jgi:quinol monooxygenase YgiN
MYVIIWEYQVKKDCAATFQEIYAENGQWAQLFRKSEGYVGTQLLQDSSKLHRYMTIDQWASRGAYETFLSNWKEGYDRLDAQCEGLTEQEILLGKWESVSHESR